ncbi:MAG: cell division control protein Cdc6, partial [Candidatus Thermoplasmatota archaeon]|nr:cell division control protein Cdc6 [Candidatus Thermoplasmatota archaeon]
DQITPVVHSLPTQQKLVLSAVLLTERTGARGVQTGEVYDVYDQACHHVGKTPLTARRVSMLISNLDMLGLITARTVSRGRYGRTKEIHSSLPPNVDAAAIIQASEPDLEPIFSSKYRHQSRL